MTVVRGLLMKEEEPDKWAVLERMMDHNEDRRAEEDEDGTFAMYLENVVQFLRVRCKLADRFSEREVRFLQGGWRKVLSQKSLQCDPSGSSQPPVDIKTKVVFQYTRGD